MIIRGNLGNVREKPTRKICFCREMKRLVLRIYQNFTSRHLFDVNGLVACKTLRSTEIKLIAETQCYACRETPL